MNVKVSEMVWEHQVGLDQAGEHPQGPLHHQQEPLLPWRWRGRRLFGPNSNLEFSFIS